MSLEFMGPWKNASNISLFFVSFLILSRCTPDGLEEEKDETRKKIISLAFVFDVGVIVGNPDFAGGG